MFAAFLPLLLSTLTFTGGHFILSSGAIRSSITGVIGEGPFRAIYSVLMIAAVVWMIGAYTAAPYQRVWDVGLFGPPVILIVMYFANFFFLCSVTTRTRP